MDYVRFGFAIIFACVAVWYIVYPENVRVLLKAPRTPFGQNPKWIIRVIGLIFAAIAIFLFREMIHSN